MKTQYIPLDSNGRIVTHPEQGKQFLRAHQKALTFFAEHPKGRLYLGPDAFRWPYVSSLTEYLEANRDLLDKRINITGKVFTREPRDGFWPLMRDKRAIEDFLIRRIRSPGSGLETRTARSRFPEIHARMKEHS